MASKTVEKKYIKKRNRAESPPPPKNLRKTIKLTDLERHKLEKFKKKKLLLVAKLAGEKPHHDDTKKILAHRLAHNKQIAFFLSAGLSLATILLLLKKKQNPKLQDKNEDDDEYQFEDSLSSVVKAINREKEQELEAKRKDLKKRQAELFEKHMKDIENNKKNLGINQPLTY